MIHHSASSTLTSCIHAPQASASAAEASQPASELCAGRGHWLYFTAPEQPAAGGEAVVYFNKACSEPLRCRGVPAEGRLLHSLRQSCTAA